MKKLVLLTAAFAFIATASFSQGISGTGHDFKGDSWSGNKICEPCHTPHNAVTAVTDAPLWNHALSSSGGFTIYTSSTLNATPGQPAGISKLCLGCHDGVVALEDFGGVTTGTTKLVSSDAGYVGTDLSNDHPVSLTYDVSDPELHATTNNLPTSGQVADVLFSGKIECASGHDPHNNANGSFLIRTNANSALCLACHNK